MTEEKLNERCPCCDKEISWYRDYPLIQIISVSSIKPEEMPRIICGRDDEELVEKPRRSFFGSKKGTAVPADVVSYFNEHPGESEYAPSDGYIYTRTLSPRDCRHPEKSGVKASWRRTPNLSDSIREVVKNNTPLRRYLASLEEMVGKTISTKDFINQFGTESEQGPRQVADGLYFMFGEGETEEGFRTVKFELGANPVDLGRLHREIYYSIVLDNLATVRYVGKMLK